MKTTLIGAATGVLFASTVFAAIPSFAQAQSTEDFVKKVAISDMSRSGRVSSP
jgi:hypothetical protein